jgi:hypothetical protein
MHATGYLNEDILRRRDDGGGTICSAHRAKMIVHELLECYNVVKEEHDEEDPRNVQVPKTEGE